MIFITMLWDAKFVMGGQNLVASRFFFKKLQWISIITKKRTKVHLINLFNFLF